MLLLLYSNRQKLHAKLARPSHSNKHTLSTQVDKRRIPLPLPWVKLCSSVLARPSHPILLTHSLTHSLAVPTVRYVTDCFASTRCTSVSSSLTNKSDQSSSTVIQTSTRIPTYKQLIHTFVTLLDGWSHREQHFFFCPQAEEGTVSITLRHSFLALEPHKK